jgi:hypothetical protein
VGFQSFQVFLESEFAALQQSCNNKLMTASLVCLWMQPGSHYAPCNWRDGRHCAALGHCMLQQLDFEPRPYSSRLQYDFTTAVMTMTIWSTWPWLNHQMYMRPRHYGWQVQHTMWAELKLSGGLSDTVQFSHTNTAAALLSAKASLHLTQQMRTHSDRYIRLRYRMLKHRMQQHADQTAASQLGHQ